jgi:uncharacterized protein YodC (DUF2158 family)
MKSIYNIGISNNQGLIRAGSIVELMSGGQKMTTYRDAYDSIECWWFNPQGELCKQEFPAAMLTYSV